MKLLVHGSGFRRPYRNDPEELRCGKPKEVRGHPDCNWFPSSLDWESLGRSSGGGTPVGVVSPSVIPGALHIGGNFRQMPLGTLVLQVGGHQPADYSSLIIGGQAQLAGTLQINAQRRGPNLKIGQQIVLLSASGGVQGRFDTVNNPFSSGTIVVAKVAYEPNAVVLEGAQGSFLSLRRSSKWELSLRRTGANRLRSS